jgi:hypothetical protein
MTPARDEPTPAKAASTQGRLRVRRRLTETPLARQYEHTLLAKGPRSRKAIPWKSFDRTKYPEAALRVAAASQAALALGEYGAVDLFAHLAIDLSLHGAPFDLVALCAKAPADEMRHADYAMRMATLYAGNPVTVELDREGLAKVLAKRMSLEELDVMMLEVAVMSETLAVALLSECARVAKDTLARAVFASLVADEVHHARLGWYYMAWRSPMWSLAERQHVADRAGQILVGTERQFWRGRDAPAGHEDAARALGVMGSMRQREVIGSIVEDEIVPGLDALGLGASHAWRVRRRGG